MTAIQLVNPLQKDGTLPLGAACEFAITAPPDVAWRACIKFESVFYPDPLVDWNRGSGARFIAESPGRYELVVISHGTSGARETASLAFHVSAGCEVNLAPRQVRVNRGHRVWAPTGWEAVFVSEYEPSALEAVKRLVRPGQTAYDIGANLGVYALQLLRCVGESGRVYCFEFNPVCVQFLLANVQAGGHRNCSILPVALGDGDAPLTATINYGRSALGLTGASAFHGGKTGHEISVQSARLDTLVEDFALQKPDFLKIDVEGAEAHVIAGMEKTLAAHRPVLLMELHGRAAADATLRRLDRFGYGIEDLGTGRRAAGAEEFVAAMPDQPVQVLCRV